jgi:hypothetical protein
MQGNSRRLHFDGELSFGRSLFGYESRVCIMCTL